jgi:steroid delta-isomerase-like uncharacterized protein
MAENEAIRVAREGIDGFSAGDWERQRALSAPDAVYYEPATGRRVEGVEEFIRVGQAWKAAFPDARGTVTNALASGGTAVLEITWEGTQTGDLETPGGTIPATGRRVTLPAVQVVVVSGGKVRETRHYFDLMGMLQQLGAVPGAG